MKKVIIDDTTEDTIFYTQCKSDKLYLLKFSDNTYYILTSIGYDGKFKWINLDNSFTKCNGRMLTSNNISEMFFTFSEREIFAFDNFNELFEYCIENEIGKDD